jgi:hypothetical protein
MTEYVILCGQKFLANYHVFSSGTKMVWTSDPSRACRFGQEIDAKEVLLRLCGCDIIPQVSRIR